MSNFVECDPFCLFDCSSRTYSYRRNPPTCSTTLLIVFVQLVFMSGYKISQIYCKPDMIN